MSIILGICVIWLASFAATIFMLWRAANHAPIISLDSEIEELLRKADQARDMARRVAL